MHYTSVRQYAITKLKQEQQRNTKYIRYLTRRMGFESQVEGCRFLDNSPTWSIPATTVAMLDKSPGVITPQAHCRSGRGRLAGAGADVTTADTGGSTTAPETAGSIARHEITPAVKLLQIYHVLSNLERLYNKANLQCIASLTFHKVQLTPQLNFMENKRFFLQLNPLSTVK